MDLEFLVIFKKTPNKIEYIIQAVTADLKYPWDHSINGQIYQGTKAYDVGIDKTT